MNRINCAIYTRKSSDEGLEKEFNSLDAQREACEAYVKSQKHAGWLAVGDKSTIANRRNARPTLPSGEIHCPASSGPR